MFNVKLKYVEQLNLQSSTFTTLTTFWRGNVPYDPDNRLGGDSAYEFERFANVYRYCRCYASKINVKVCAINQSPQIMVIVPKTTEEVVDIELARADRRAKRTGWMNPNGSSGKSLSNYCTTKAIFGLKQVIDDGDHDYDFNTFNNLKPAHEWWWNLIVAIPPSASQINGAVDIEIIYYCRFFERKQPLKVAADDDTDTGVGWEGGTSPGTTFNPDP